MLGFKALWEGRRCQCLLVLQTNPLHCLSLPDFRLQHRISVLDMYRKLKHKYTKTHSLSLPH